MRQLEIYLDLSNIAGYAAITGAQKLIADTGVSTAWLPIEGVIARPLSRKPKLDANDPLSAYKSKRYMAKHQFELAELKRDCQRLDLDIELASQTFESRLTHLACMALIRKAISPVEFMLKVYELRLRQGKPLEDKVSVERLIAAFGVDDFSDQLDRLKEHWDKHEARYLELGIHDTPAFVLDDETFQGRQHLPLILWRLKGEVGAPPL